MFSMMHIIDVSVLLSFLIACHTFYGYQRRRGLPYPPGPPGWPVIGNLFDLPPMSTWLAYTEFSKKYGMAAYLCQSLFLRPGGRAHCVLPCSRK